MEKEGILNLELIDNRDTNNPVNTPCDLLIDRNGNIIYKSYNSIYKLTYKHIFKYKRISTIATDVILDVHYNSYIPLYHQYYFDIDEECWNDISLDQEVGVNGSEEGKDNTNNNNNSNNNNEKVSAENENIECAGAKSTNAVAGILETDVEAFIDQTFYNWKCPKKHVIRYDLNELLLLRFVTCDKEYDIEGELSKHCFLKEKKPISSNRISNGSPVRFQREKSLNNSLNINLNDIAALSNSNNSALSAALNFNSSGRLRSAGTSAGEDPLSNRLLNNYQAPSLNALLTLNALNQLNHVQQLNQVNCTSPMSSQRLPNSVSPVGSMQAGNLMHGIGNVGNKIFKNVDDSYYNSPTNNIYIDKDGKMHLVSGEVGGSMNFNKGGYNYNHNYNSSNNNIGSNTRIMHNRFDRNAVGYHTNNNNNNRDRDIVMGDFEYSSNFGNTERGTNRKNGAEKYWDNPISYPKGTAVDIFTLGDIKKFSKNYDMRRNNNNNINFNDNNYSIFKDNEEDNLTKSNFAKWFKNSSSNGNENVTPTNYAENKNRSDDIPNMATTVNNTNTNTGNNTVNDESNNSGTTNDNKCNNEEANAHKKKNENENIQSSGSAEESGEEKIRGTVAELLVKQISVLKDRNVDGKGIEQRGSFEHFQNTAAHNVAGYPNLGLNGDNELYGKEAGKRLLEMFKNYNAVNGGYTNYQHPKARNSMGQSNMSSPVQYQQYPGSLPPHHLQQLQHIHLQQMQQLQQIQQMRHLRQLQNLQQFQHLQRQLRSNPKMYNFHNKGLNADHFSYKKGYGADTYINGNSGNVNFNHGEYQGPNKRMGRNRESVNNFMFSEKNKNVAHHFTPYQYRNNMTNSDAYMKGGAVGGLGGIVTGVAGGLGGVGMNGKSHGYNNGFDMNRNRSKNKSQGNINITPIINSLLHIDNDYEQSDEDLINSSHDAYMGNNLQYGNATDGDGGAGAYMNHNVGNYMYGNGPGGGNSISENIQNAKVNNVLESLKSLLKASKGHDGISDHGSNDHSNDIGQEEGVLHDTYNNMNMPKGFPNVNGDDHVGAGDVFDDVNSSHVFPMHHGQQSQRVSYKDINKNMFFKKEKFNTKYQEQEINGSNGSMAQKKW